MEANGGVYDIEQDPLWNGEQRSGAVPRAFDRKEMAFYQCDHLGTPQELTDHEGAVAWSAQYKAWGEAREGAHKQEYPRTRAVQKSYGRCGSRRAGIGEAGTPIPSPERIRPHPPPPANGAR